MLHKFAYLNILTLNENSFNNCLFFSKYAKFDCNLSVVYERLIRNHLFKILIAVAFWAFECIHVISQPDNRKRILYK